MTEAQSALVFAGLVLFTLGLLNGLAIPVMRSPRLALSAHLGAVQSGTFLMAAGYALPQIGMSGAWSFAVAAALAGSVGLLWIANLLAAFWGAGRDLPLAGQGQSATPSRQRLVRVLLALGSISTLLTCIVMIVAWLSAP